MVPPRFLTTTSSWRNSSGAKLDEAHGVPAGLIPGETIARGIAKVNTDSDLRLAAIGRLRQVLDQRPDIFNLYELMGEMEAAIGDTVAQRIELLGSAGKA
jgi:fructose-bisphosphate aldolase class II